MSSFQSRALNLHRLVYCCAGGLLVANCLPHLLPSYAKASCELPGVQAPQALVSHVRKIADAMGIVNSDRIDVFISSGYASVCGGSTVLPQGAVLGLPRVVLFEGPEDVKNAQPTLRGEPVLWDSPEGKALLTLLPPTADMVNFRIAHEVAHLMKHDWVWSALLSPVMLVAGYHVTVFICKTVFSASVSLAFPLSLVAIVLAFTEINSFINHRQEFRADRTAASCSHKYAKGGVEFMRAAVQLDALGGGSRSDPKQFLTLEHVVNALSSSHPPYDRRLNKLEEIYSLYNNSRRD